MARAAAGLSAALFLLTVGAQGARAQEWLEMSTARQADGVHSIDMEIVYGAGLLTLQPARSGDLYDAHFRYDASRFSPLREFDRSGGSVQVRLGVTSLHGKNGKDIHLDWNDITSGDFDMDSGSKAGSLVVGVSRQVPTDLQVKVGAAKSRMSLGGLPLTGLSIETGASETRLDFAEPNPSTMDEFRVKAGAASLEARHLGNARFRHFRVEGGVGDVSLDFGGDWTTNATGSIHVGLGSLSLHFPSDLGVKIDKSTVLASFSAAGFVKTDGGYQTRNWDTAAHHLELDINAAFGSIDVDVGP